MFRRKGSYSGFLIALGIGVIIAICLPPDILAALLAVVLVWAGIKLLCK